jgi:8-oxo-dGTP pyrophosphatase MutT (NUDIX family)
MIPQLSTVPNAGLPAGYRKKTPNGNARMGAGIMFTNDEGKALFVRRSKEASDHQGEWAFPGGHVEEDEEPADAARREAMEEVGHIEGWDLAPIHRETSNEDHVDFTTFGQPVSMEFKPRLNHEHDAHEWCDPAHPPEPLHPGVASLLARFFKEEAREPEHAGDQRMKAAKKDVAYTDYASDQSERCGICRAFNEDKCKKVAGVIESSGWCKLFSHVPIGATDSQLVLALDATVRSFDTDGRMRVSRTNISKATVNPYRGEEIPTWEALGLIPDKVYQMYRPAHELALGAKTFNSVQLLKKHTPVDIEDHKMWDIVGTTGSDAEFDGTYLTNSLSVWAKEAIDFIESGAQRELSCGYHYVPVMTPGIFDGKPYDGVMTQIEGNHVALVEEGRAGHDCVVGDSALSQRDSKMTKPTRLEHAVLTRTASAINPLLAKDAKVNYAPLFKGLTTKNFKERRPAIVEGMRKLIKGKTIAQDASIEHLAHMLDHFEHAPAIADESVSGSQHRAMEAAAHGHSTLGIPKNVGEEFSKADKGKTFGDMIRDWAAAKDWNAGMSDDDFSALDKMHSDCKDGAMGGRDKEETPEEFEKAEHEIGGGEDRRADDRRGGRDRRGHDRRADDEEEEGGEEFGKFHEKEGEDEWEDKEDEGEDQLENLGSAARDRRADDRRADDRRDARDRRDGYDRKGGRDKKGAKDAALTQDSVNKMIEDARMQERRRAKNANAAREFIRPYVGAVSMALDSAEQVLRAGAKALEIENADKLHPDALKPLIKMTGDMRMRRVEYNGGELAMDTDMKDDGIAKFNNMFGADRIKTV